ncbi:MAG: CopG family transcriptional regulator [Leptolyngbya sp. SIO4C5]|nr:CopG family transcriptional regulator [Leptolyngbya sp. SIO4C5]
MEKPLVATRVPHSWVAQIEELSQETGKSQSEIVREALSQYLGKTDPDAVATMARRLSKLEQQYKKLAQLI